MYLRKIAAAAGFATGAALAFAPLAAAAPVDPTLVTDTLGSEVSSLNSAFQFDALLSSVPSGDYAPTGVHGLDTLLIGDVLKDAPQSGTPSTLDYLLYGVEPFKAGVSGDSGAFSEFNGALTQFDNAYNVEVYSAANGVLDTNVPDYIYNSTIVNVLGTAGETPTQAFDSLYNAGIGDLSGFFQTNLASLEIPLPAASEAASTVSIASTLTSEANSLNSIFASDVAAAGINADKIIPGTGVLPFDTIDTANTNSVFDTLVFGLNPASVTGDPGAYDVFNGSLGEFANAFNVEYYSLLNSGDLLPAADIIGTHAELATVATSVAEYLQLGLSDLAGYF